MSNFSDDNSSKSFIQSVLGFSSMVSGLIAWGELSNSPPNRSTIKAGLGVCALSLSGLVITDFIYSNYHPTKK